MLHIDTEYMMKCLDLEDKEFAEAFWNWFDSLTTEERRIFDEHKDDMAKLFFFNRHWSSRKRL